MTTKDLQHNHPLENYKQFYLHHGIRTASQLTSAPWTAAADFVLPKMSYYHHYPINDLDVGPRPGNPYIKGNFERVYVNHITDLTFKEGNPKEIPGSLDSVIRAYRNKFLDFRPLLRPDSIDSKLNDLVIDSYSLILQSYTYLRSAFRVYYQWRNIRRTIAARINALTGTTERAQFIQMDIPERVLPFAKYRDPAAQANLTADKVIPLSNNGQLDVYDLLTWIGPHRDKSTLNEIEKKNLGHVNVIVQTAGRAIVINLGVVDSWRQDTGDKTGRTPAELQVIFYNWLHKFWSESIALSEKPEVDVAKIDAVDAEENERHLSELSVDPVEVDDAETYEEIDDDGNVVVHEASKEHGNTSLDFDDLAPELGIRHAADLMADKGLVTASEYKRMLRLGESYKTIPSPFPGHEGKTLADHLTIPQEALRVESKRVCKDSHRILDKSLLESRVDDFDRRYINGVIQHDLVRCVMQFQREGLAITSWEIEEHVDLVNGYHEHILRVAPVDGKESTIRFRTPIVDDEGTYVSNGTRYRLKKQRSDVPIRKVSPDRVALSSYYAKIFVDRDQIRAANYTAWIGNRLVAMALNREDDRITEARIGEVINDKHQVPYIYGTISLRLMSFKMKTVINGSQTLVDMFFDYEKRVSRGGFTEEEIKLDRNGNIIAGRYPGGLVRVNRDNTFTAIGKDGAESPLGTIEDILEIVSDNKPVQMTVAEILGMSVPVGVIVAYLIGFTKMLEHLGVRYRTAVAGERLNLRNDEYVIRFSDVTYIFLQEDVRNEMLINGFNRYKDIVGRYPAPLFDNRDVYISVFAANGIGISKVRRLELMSTMFVDPITRDILAWMNEPTEFVDLIIRATDLLRDRHVPNRREIGGLVENLERIRGYERIPGQVYSSLVKALDEYRARSGVKGASFTINPLDVWVKTVDDSAAEICQEINAIQPIKEKEVMTVGGNGGRSARSMTAEHRLYTEGDDGLVSEATVDSSNVAIITYVSPNSTITTVRGTTRRFDPKKDGSSSLLSTAALLSAGSDRDDPKRTNFTNVQHTHGIYGTGYRPNPVRTGGEEVIASRTSRAFAFKTKKPGVVTSIDDEHITVTYNDGTTDSSPLGVTHGASGGLYLAHNLVSDMKVGMKFGADDIIAYHEGFFEPIPGAKHTVVWKAGAYVKAVFMETSYTLEDSSGISVDLSNLLGKTISHIKNVQIRFDQSIINPLKVGDHVDLETILCTILEQGQEDSGIFDDAAADALRLVSASTPKANLVGHISKIEVFYNGEVEEMSESLGAFVNEYDRRRIRLQKKLKVPVVVGQVDQSYRIQGEGLMPGMVSINFHIDHSANADVGDKIVVCNQMKSIIGTRLVGRFMTKSGVAVDLVFGLQSNINRIVLSSFFQGAIGNYLVGIGDQAYHMFFD